MELSKVGPGQHLPEEVNVIIEIPSHSEPIKYEVDKQTGALFVDRFMSTPMHYPCDYGYVPHTLSEDGDPVDVLVVSPMSLTRGCVVRCRPVGILMMEDESGIDAKIIAVPMSQLTPLYDHIKESGDLAPLLLKQIEFFFSHYKDLEPNKWVKIKGWASAKEAKQEIVSSAKRYQDEPDKPAF